MSKQHPLLLVAALCSLSYLAGCASPPVVARVAPGDEALTCEQLQDEYNEVQRVKLDAGKEKSVERNVVRAVFWPLIAASVINANKSQAAADARMEQLSSYMKPKACEAPSGPDTTADAKPREIFRGRVTSVQVIASTQRMTAVPMPGGGVTYMQVGQAQSWLLTIQPAGGRARSVHSFEAYEAGACLAAVAQPEVPAGLLRFEASDVRLSAQVDCP